MHAPSRLYHPVHRNGQCKHDRRFSRKSRGDVSRTNADGRVEKRRKGCKKKKSNESVKIIYDRCRKVFFFFISRRQKFISCLSIELRFFPGGTRWKTAGLSVESFDVQEKNRVSVAEQQPACVTVSVYFPKRLLSIDSIKSRTLLTLYWNKCYIYIHTRFYYLAFFYREKIGYLNSSSIIIIHLIIVIYLE